MADSSGNPGKRKEGDAPAGAQEQKRGRWDTGAAPAPVQVRSPRDGLYVPLCARDELPLHGSPRAQAFCVHSPHKVSFCGSLDSR